MRKTFAVSLVVLLVGLAATANLALARDKESAGRLLIGKVVDRNDQTLPNAVVYLTNSRTRAIRTYIVKEDGVYRFPALSPNIDYEVYAQYNGRKSDTKTVSQIESRQQVTINLRIDAK